MVFVIDLFYENNYLFHFRCFKTKRVKESQGEINILLLILPLKRILKKKKKRIDAFRNNLLKDIL